jgi:hypothetical protein
MTQSNLRSVNQKEKRWSSDRREKDCRAADQRISGRTLGRVARPLVEIIDLPGGGVGGSVGGGGRGAAARVGSV